MNEIDNLRSNVFSKNKKKEWNQFDIWNYLMIHYGWIPYEEYVNLPANIVNELVERINKMNEKSHGEIPKIGRKR